MSQQENKCSVAATKNNLEKFYYDDSKDGMCSKCHPCKLGIYDAIKIFELIQAGKGAAKHVAQLQRIAADVKDGGMCKKGKDHADILGAFLKEHSEDLNRHIKGVCTSLECKYLIRYEINPDKCTMCDKCREACKDFAIEGMKAVQYKGGFTPYRIRQKRCTHCGECIKVCPEGAIFVSEAALAVEEEGHVSPERHAVGTCPI
ncbi:MAG TPA: NADH-ubiquinone oxidoreductase-F iron-sulfur binding region domain-containing protein [Nitrospirota bacterium]|nr:NADH-ubiquinone oxidoreductase-F iron-sulfur binding region domain-containing protein [Nitrospirota bacterium]